MTRISNVDGQRRPAAVCDEVCDPAVLDHQMLARQAAEDECAPTAVQKPADGLGQSSRCDLRSQDKHIKVGRWMSRQDGRHSLDALQRQVFTRSPWRMLIRPNYERTRHVRALQEEGQFEVALLELLPLRSGELAGDGVQRDMALRKVDKVVVQRPETKQVGNVICRDIALQRGLDPTRVPVAANQSGSTFHGRAQHTGPDKSLMVILVVIVCDGERGRVQHVGRDIRPSSQRLSVGCRFLNLRKTQRRTRAFGTLATTFCLRPLTLIEARKDSGVV
jgi:hypothetical protein